MEKVADIQFIGNEVAVKWEDGFEGFIAMDRLRQLSPSAETKGETDLLGNPIGGGADSTRDFSGVVVTGWAPVGSYAIQFSFSDGHKTGLYSFDYLRQICSGET